MDGVALRERVRKLREEIAELRRSDEQYLRFHTHTQVEMKAHVGRSQRMEEIIRELADLMKRRMVR